MVDNTKEEKKDLNKDIKKRFFHLNEGVSAGSVKPIMQGILEINEYDSEQEKLDENYKRKPIKLIVDSFGGSMYDGLGLVSVIDNSLTPVHGYCYSKAMSMALAIYSVCHQRFAHPLAVFMYHDGATSLGDKVEGLKQSLAQLEKVVEMTDLYIVSCTNIKKEKLDEVKLYKQDWYMFTDEAKKRGIVDEILVSNRQKNRG